MTGSNSWRRADAEKRRRLNGAFGVGGCFSASELKERKTNTDVVSRGRRGQGGRWGRTEPFARGLERRRMEDGGR